MSELDRATDQGNKVLTSFDTVTYDILAEFQQPVVWLSCVSHLQIKKLFQLFRRPPFTNLEIEQQHLQLSTQERMSEA